MSPATEAAGALKATAAVITAAGSSLRMGGVKKEYRSSGRLDSDGRELTVLGSAVRAFFDSPTIRSIVITVPEGGEAAARSALPSRFFSPGAIPVRFVSGGSTRRRSVHEALKILPPGTDFVLIHDGARPFLSATLVERTVEAVRSEKAVIPVLPLVETPKELGPDGRIVRHLRRALIVSAQTPQAFSFDGILKAHDKAKALEDTALATGEVTREFTDDAELWDAFVGQVATIPGENGNRKITFPEDLP